MIYVFFIYGLAFFALGFSLLLYPKQNSAFWFARSLNYVGIFGVLHGFNEWLDMFTMIHGTRDWLAVQIVRTVLLGSSFLFLLLFGISSVIKVRNSRGVIVPRFQFVCFVLFLRLSGYW